MSFDLKQVASQLRDLRAELSLDGLSLPERIADVSARLAHTQKRPLHTPLSALHRPCAQRVWETRK